MSSLGDGFNEAKRRMIAAVERGVEKAAMALLNDCIASIPKAPIDVGILRASGSAGVNGRIIATSISGGDGTPNEDFGFTKSAAEGVIRACVGFNTEYAAYLHEGISAKGNHLNYGSTREKRGAIPDEGTGAKFLEKKLSGNRDKYMKIVVSEIRRDFG